MKIGQHPDTSPPSGPVGPNSSQKTPAQASVRESAVANANANAAQGARSAGVAVTVSTLARSMEKPPVSNGAEVDTAKVAAVKTAIQNGTYVVNHEAIADKLLSNAQEMLARTTN